MSWTSASSRLFLWIVGTSLSGSGAHTLFVIYCGQALVGMREAASDAHLSCDEPYDMPVHPSSSLVSASFLLPQVDTNAPQSGDHRLSDPTLQDLKYILGRWGQRWASERDVIQVGAAIGAGCCHIYMVHIWTLTLSITILKPFMGKGELLASSGRPCIYAPMT